MLDFLFVILWNLFRFSPACKPRSVYCFRCHYSNTFLKSNNDKVTVIRIITKNHFPLCAKIDKKKKPDEWCCCIKTDLKNIHSFIFFLSWIDEKEVEKGPNNKASQDCKTQCICNFDKAAPGAGRGRTKTLPSLPWAQCFNTEHTYMFSFFNRGHIHHCFYLRQIIQTDNELIVDYGKHVFLWLQSDVHGIFTASRIFSDVHKAKTTEGTFYWTFCWCCYEENV